jgi:hypothetical protein
VDGVSYQIPSFLRDAPDQTIVTFIRAWRPVKSVERKDEKKT